MPETTIEDAPIVLARGDDAWAMLTRALDARLHEPVGPHTNWTGHDVYAHFARWQQQSIDDLRIVLSGAMPPPPEADDDTLNNLWRAQDRDLPTEVVVKRCRETRATLRQMLLDLESREWRDFGHLFAPDINGEHYEHHLAICDRELLR